MHSSSKLKNVRMCVRNKSRSGLSVNENELNEQRLLSRILLKMSLNYNFYRKKKSALKKPQPTRRPKKMRKRRRH